jgi:hypothetical protein
MWAFHLILGEVRLRVRIRRGLPADKAPPALRPARLLFAGRWAFYEWRAAGLAVTDPLPPLPAGANPAGGAGRPDPASAADPVSEAGLARGAGPSPATETAAGGAGAAGRRGVGVPAAAGGRTPPPAAADVPAPGVSPDASPHASGSGSGGRGGASVAVLDGRRKSAAAAAAARTARAEEAIARARDHVAAFAAERGREPTGRELGEHFGRSEGWGLGVLRKLRGAASDEGTG